MQLENHRRRNRAADFSNVKDWKWEFCCSLLRMTPENYELMRAGVGPPDERMDDPDCDHLVYIMNEWEIMTDSISYADLTHELMKWFLENKHIKFDDIRKSLTGENFELLLDICNEYQIAEDHIPSCDAAYNLYRRLKEQVCKRL